MKKLDKLILGSFIGPFLLTFIVVDFILLTVNMLKYFDEIFGKGLGFGIYMELIGYFVISISPMALPLAVLLSSLMTFGNLGEHFELTAIKSSGISLIRAMAPIGVFVVVLTFLAYLSNNYLVPKVNLKTFSLLYDIRTKSPAFDIKEGIFYNGIPNYSIKVNRKKDDIRLEDVMIYDHTSGQGNIHVIVADSGRMEPFFNDRYMMMTLYSGYSYNEERGQRGIREKPVDFRRTQFSQYEIIFSLDAFNLNRTSEDQWSTNRSIKNIAEIKVDLDSMDRDLTNLVFYNFTNASATYNFFTAERQLSPPDYLQTKKDYYDSIKNEALTRQKEQELKRNSEADSLKNIEGNELSSDSLSKIQLENPIKFDSLVNPSLNPSTSAAVNTSDSVLNARIRRSRASAATSSTQSRVQNLERHNARGKDTTESKRNLVFTEAQKARLDSIIEKERYNARGASIAINNARTFKNTYSLKKNQLEDLEREYRRFKIAWYQKYTQAFACIVMFMIGAPLGAIIKKGGLGMPVLFSIIFFIIFYMLTITGEKWAKEGMSSPLFGTWFSNLALIPFGLFFLKQARKDARLFEPDLYVELFQKGKKKWQELLSKYKR
ncbi:LptF/LptG family permease [Pararhodonellum marinum]|uniref:LptF/LptG family permease n=1 Tax=Pararhodonellum marinum TaxID=2755358 RepID=UPI00188ED04E|nr:LptF/LptG family permease [Pararhodonellum marinum]